LSLDINRIYNDDCLNGLSKIKEESIDLVFTDPPYGINFGKNEGLYNRSKEGVIDGYIDIPQEDYESFSEDWIKECFRVLRSSGSIYIVSGDRNLEFVLRGLRKAGFHVLNHLSWSYQFGVWNTSKYITSHNSIIFAVKDIKKYRFYPLARYSLDERTDNGKSANNKDRKTNFNISKERWSKVNYTTPTKLPKKLLEKIFSYSSIEDDIILDPFLGSGQSAFIAREMGRKYIGFEKSENIYEFAKRRLKENSYFIPINK
jgi:site-specific DNA-methyltransferase (adenine-specific)